MTVYGDFSRRIPEGFAGVLYQQGRVFLDTDGTAQTLITMDWQDTAARDAIGAGVAAVPIDARESFRVVTARRQGGEVVLDVQPGRVWADGLLVRLAEGQPGQRVTRRATYLVPPVQDPPGTPESIANGVRDAVVLEVWREAVHGFQLPDMLIEPALGGPDTTERLSTTFDFRLFRLADGETCETIHDKLNPPANGRLTVRLEPTIQVGGDCPVVEGGGYTGFEHNLYRIETMAGPGPGRFKFSQFNGGLVGRAKFVAPDRAEIEANLQAITSCGLPSFYLEALDFDANLGVWRVVYAAENVTIDAEDRLVLPTGPGTQPLPAGSFFIRLWNGVRAISEFLAGANLTKLQDGILLGFDLAAAGGYPAGTYWTFSVRAAGVGNEELLLDSAPPEGVRLHRVPLAVLGWNNAGQSTVEDCRRVFLPLTQIESCCSFQVGDGVNSHGEFTSIQDAVDALPVEGGEVCVLPGVYQENVAIAQRRNVTISGCGGRSRVVSPPPREGQAGPVFRVVDSQGVRIAGLEIEAHATGGGVLCEDTIAEGLALKYGNHGASGSLSRLTLADLHVVAATRPAIEVQGALDAAIRDCVIEMSDAAGDAPAVFFQGEDSLIERNHIRVRTRTRDRDRAVAWPRDALNLASEGTPVLARSAWGGLQLGGLSERVRVIENLIQGGTGNGVTLGSIRLVDRENRELPRDRRRLLAVNDPGRPATLRIPDLSIRVEDPLHVSAGPLEDIQIRGNRILDMGLNGISVVGFFNLDSSLDTIAVNGLSIAGNEIRRCLRRALEPTEERMADRMGYGGVTLAQVERLVVCDNVIEDNGSDYLDPVCGVFVLSAEGAEISRNRIVNNGRRTADPPTRARAGRRGGIHIVHAVPPPGEPALENNVLQLPRGEAPALRVYNNVVSVPLGQALNVTAIGPVAVHGNYFTSLGVVPLPAGAIRAEYGATVMINNLGWSEEEQPKPRRFRSIAAGLKSRLRFATRTEAAIEATTAASVVLRKQLQPAYEKRQLASGLVMFSDNQCLLDLASLPRQVERPPRISILPLAEPALTLLGARPALSVAFAVATATAPAAEGTPAAAPAAAAPAATLTGAAWGGVEFIRGGRLSPAVLGLLPGIVDRPIQPVGVSALPQPDLRISSVSIRSADDIAFDSNQCLTDLESGTILSQVYVFGSSVRVTNNRFKEGPADALFSAVTFGEINVTTSNQCTHCLIVRPSGAPNRTVADGNIVVVTRNDPNYCAPFDKVMADFGG
jgi:hypothetical protein